MAYAVRRRYSLDGGMIWKGSIAIIGAVALSRRGLSPGETSEKHHEMTLPKVLPGSFLM
jgi:hypothetical protein